MANYIVSYDLNGPNPSHKQIDDLLETLGAGRGRILETVWWVGYSGTRKELFDSIWKMMSADDRLIVAEASEAVWQNLLITDDSLTSAWDRNR